MTDKQVIIKTDKKTAATIWHWMNEGQHRGIEQQIRANAHNVSVPEFWEDEGIAETFAFQRVKEQIAKQVWDEQ